MRLLVLAAMAVGINALGIHPPPMGFRVHIWSCNEPVRGNDHGVSVLVDQTQRGTFASLTSQSIMGPQKIGEYKVNGGNSALTGGEWLYVDTATHGRRFTLSINAAGQGNVRAIGDRGQRVNKRVRCFRTRGR